LRGEAPETYSNTIKKGREKKMLKKEKEFCFS
jgi:hypothetical protein